MTNNRYEDDVGFADIPPSAALSIIRVSEQTDSDDESIEWAEVERLLFEQDWGPILALPAKKYVGLPRQMEDGVNVSAFNTVDFVRLHGSVKRSNYALSVAMQKHQEAVWTLEMIMDRIPSLAKYKVLELVERGVIDPSMCEGDMRGAAKWHLRCLDAMDQIVSIRKAGMRRFERSADS